MSMSTEIRPTLGSQASRTAKMYLRMMARKKIGIEIPISDATRLMWSKSPPCRLAAMKPSGTPARTANSIAASASSTVAGKRCLISAVTRRREATLTPRSPWTVVLR